MMARGGAGGADRPLEVIFNNVIKGELITLAERDRLLTRINNAKTIKPSAAATGGANRPLKVVFNYVTRGFLITPAEKEELSKFVGCATTDTEVKSDKKPDESKSDPKESDYSKVVGYGLSAVVAAAIAVVAFGSRADKIVDDARADADRRLPPP